MAKLSKNVWVRGHGWYGPAYPDAGNPPAGTVTNPQCWDDEAPSAPAAPSTAEQAPANPAPAPVGKPPPKSGKGATDAAWTKFAEANNVQVTEAMTRGEVIAACEAKGVPTE